MQAQLSPKAPASARLLGAQAFENPRPSPSPQRQPASAQPSLSPGFLNKTLLFFIWAIKTFLSIATVSNKMSAVSQLHPEPVPVRLLGALSC